MRTLPLALVWAEDRFTMEGSDPLSESAEELDVFDGTPGKMHRPVPARALEPEAIARMQVRAGLHREPVDERREPLLLRLRPPRRSHSRPIR